MNQKIQTLDSLSNLNTDKIEASELNEYGKPIPLDEITEEWAFEKVIREIDKLITDGGLIRQYFHRMKQFYIRSAIESANRGEQLSLIRAELKSRGIQY